MRWLSNHIRGRQFGAFFFKALSARIPLFHCLLSVVALVLVFPASSSGQVLSGSEFDVSPAQGDIGPFDERRHPYWEAIEQQQQVFAEAFQQSWTADEMALDLSMPSHDDFLTTGGFTAGGEWFISILCLR